MSLLSALKARLRIPTERKANVTSNEIESVHTPSFSIGDSIGDVKVGLMDLKTRLERIETYMLSREYFDDAMNRRDRTDVVISKLDEALRVLSDFQLRKPSIEPSKPNLQTSLTEQTEDHVKKAIESLRLKQVMTMFNNRNRMTPKQLAQLLGIKNNTATEHLRKLEKLGHVRRVSRGLYAKLEQKS